MPFNSPQIDGKRVRHTHKDFQFNHKGTEVHIKPNGRITLSQASKEKDAATGDILVDEIEVPASLIFDVAKLLHMTRVTEVVDTESSHAVKNEDNKGS